MENYPATERVIPLSPESFMIFLEFIRENRYFYRIALKARREFPIKQGFEALWEQIIKPLSLKAGISSEGEMMFYFVGFQAGLTTVLKRWVEHDCVEETAKIAQIIHDLIPSIWKKENLHT